MGCVSVHLRVPALAESPDAGSPRTYGGPGTVGREEKPASRADLAPPGKEAGRGKAAPAGAQPGGGGKPEDSFFSRPCGGRPCAVLWLRADPGGLLQEWGCSTETPPLPPGRQLPGDTRCVLSPPLPVTAPRRAQLPRKCAGKAGVRPRMFPLPDLHPVSPAPTCTREAQARSFPPTRQARALRDRLLSVPVQLLCRSVLLDIGSHKQVLFPLRREGSLFHIQSVVA